VIELGLIVLILLGWQFLVAEYAAGPLMIVLLAFAFRAMLDRRLVDQARTQAEKGYRWVSFGRSALCCCCSAAR
jgi:hypothetical protein